MGNLVWIVGAFEVEVVEDAEIFLWVDFVFVEDIFKVIVFVFSFRVFMVNCVLPRNLRHPVLNILISLCPAVRHPHEHLVDHLCEGQNGYGYLTEYEEEDVEDDERVLVADVVEDEH